jgi:hypothetical protein
VKAVRLANMGIRVNSTANKPVTPKDPKLSPVLRSGASQTDLEGKQLYDSRVGAEINDEIKQNSGYAHAIFLKNNLV